MIYLNSRSDLNKLEYIASGTFGSVYKVDDKTAYKIYHPVIGDKYSGIAVHNPCLSFPKFHYKTLLSRCKKLKYTEGIQDFIYIDGAFGGIKIPYYEGKTLNKVLNEPLSIKIELSKQIIRNCKELTKNLIYSTDYKLNNIILSNNEIKLLDLDDKRTHASITPNIILKTISINVLGETIQSFFNINNHHPVSLKVKKNLERNKHFYSINYSKIEKYINDMEKEKNIIFINDESNVEKINELINNNDLKVVYVLNNKYTEENELLKIINELKINNIKLFDFTTKEKIEDYSSIESVKESYLLSNKELKKVHLKI